MKYNFFQRDVRRKGLILLSLVFVIAAGGWMILHGVPGTKQGAPTAGLFQPVPAGMLTLRGEGGMADLHVVQQRDPVLRDMVTRFSSIPAVSLLTDVTAVDRDVTAILFRWAGVDGVDPDDYGAGMDGRIVAFLQKAGQVPADVRPDMRITGEEIGRLSRLWGNGFSHYKARLLVQSVGPEMYSGSVRYDSRTDQIDSQGDLSSAFIKQFSAALDASTQKADIMGRFLDMIELTRGLSNLSAADQDMIMALHGGQEP